MPGRKISAEALIFFYKDFHSLKEGIDTEKMKE